MWKVLGLLQLVLLTTSANVHNFHKYLGYKVVRLENWLTAAGANCAELNCCINGSASTRPWTSTYYINGVRYTPSAFPNIRPLPSGSLLICIIDLDRHTGTFRCEVQGADRTSAFKELIVTRSQLQRFAQTRQESSLRVTNFGYRRRRSSLSGPICTDFTCMASGGYTPVSYTFNFPPPSSAFQIRNNVLTYCNWCPVPPGTYTCWARDNSGARSSRSLSIAGSSGTASYGISLRKDGNCLLFTCCPHSRAQATAVTMTINNRRAAQDARYRHAGSGAIRICDINYNQDQGQYSCNANGFRYRRTYSSQMLRSMMGVTEAPEPVRETSSCVREVQQIIQLNANLQACRSKLDQVRGIVRPCT
eukprot:scpid84722/ scgid29662/ 